MGLYGPKALEVVKKMLPFDLSDLEPGGVKQISMFMINATVARGSWGGLDGVEVICSNSVASMAAMALGKYKDNGSITPAGMTALNAAMVNASLPTSVDCRAEKVKLTPAIAGLADKIDSKKEFIGKEKVMA